MGKIEKAYGFSFPADLQRFWKIARVHWDALFDVGVRLIGPFTLLGGGKLPKDLERWPSDPPELFAVAEGDTDGLHWGYVFHEPGVSPGYVASFYARDGYPIEGSASTIGHAMYEHVSSVCEGMQDELDGIREVGEDDGELASAIARIRKLEKALRKEKKRFSRKKESIASIDGLGIRAPRASFERIDAKKLGRELRNKKKLEKWLARGHELIAASKAGSALQIARDTLAILPTEKQDDAAVLAIAAYEALGRPLLARTFDSRRATIKRRAKKPPKIDNRVSESMEEALLDPKGVRILHFERWGAQPKVPDLEKVSNFPNLESITLRGYKLGDLPKSFSKLRKLRSLELFECAMTTIPKSLSSLALEKLEIVQSSSGGSSRKEVRVPKGFALPKLRTVELVACGLREVPPFVFGAKRLVSLSLSGNRLRAVPKEIGKLRALRYLSLSENALTTLPDSFAKLPKLDSLWMRANRFASLPEAIGSLRLEDLDVAKNPLVKNKEERARAKKLARRAKIYFA